MGTDFRDRPRLQYREECLIWPNFGDPFHFLSWDGQSYHIWDDNSCGRWNGLYVVDCRLYPSVHGQDPAGHCVEHAQLLMVHVLISRYSVMLILQLLAVRNLCWILYVLLVFCLLTHRVQTVIWSCWITCVSIAYAATGLHSMSKLFVILGADWERPLEWLNIYCLTCDA